MHRQSPWLALSLGALLSACGARPPSETEAHALYREIQMHESRTSALLALGEHPFERAEATREVCESAKAICRAADRLDEQDARERCRRAELQCASVRRAVR